MVRKLNVTHDWATSRIPPTFQCQDHTHYPYYQSIYDGRVSPRQGKLQQWFVNHCVPRRLTATESQALPCVVLDAVDLVKLGMSDACLNRGALCSADVVIKLPRLWGVVGIPRCYPCAAPYIPRPAHHVGPCRIVVLASGNAQISKP